MSKDWKFYFEELKGEQCQCGRVKKKGRSLCYLCYKSLPRHIQTDLYMRIGAGYEAAYDGAVKFLNES